MEEFLYPVATGVFIILIFIKVFDEVRYCSEACRNKAAQVRQGKVRCLARAGSGK